MAVLPSDANLLPWMPLGESLKLPTSTFSLHPAIYDRVQGHYLSRIGCSKGQPHPVPGLIEEVVMKKLSPVIILLKPLNRPPPGGWLHLNPPVHIEHGPGFSPHSLPAVQLYFHRLHIISNYSVVDFIRQNKSLRPDIYPILL